MIFERNFQFRIRKKSAWLRGKANQSVVPLDVGQIKDLLFVSDVLSYCVEYEDGRIGYIPIHELEYCEIFSLEMKIDKATLISL